MKVYIVFVENLRILEQAVEKPNSNFSTMPFPSTEILKSGQSHEAVVRILVIPELIR